MTTLGANSPSPPPDLTPYIARGDDQYIAGGNFGDVYKCWCHNGSPQEVAVKAFRFTISIDGDANNRSTKMIHRELGIWRRLNHPNVVPFMGIAYGFGMRGAMSLVSLWMHNGSLHHFLEKHTDNLSVQHRLKFLLDIANGLCYLHSFPIVHGDLNCNNVLLDADYTARLADFGYASLVGSIPEALTYLQRSTTHPGAVRWSSPEQLEPTEIFHRTTKSDIYSFGCIVLSGKPPWSEIREDVAVVLQLARGHKPGRPASCMLDDAHWRFIQQCWSAIEERPAAGVVVYTMAQFLGKYPTFRTLSDSFLSRSSQDGLGSEPYLSSHLATTHPAVDPASVGPSGLLGLPPSITRQAIAPYPAPLSLHPVERPSSEPLSPLTPLTSSLESSPSLPGHNRQALPPQDPHPVSLDPLPMPEPTGHLVKQKQSAARGTLGLRGDSISPSTEDARAEKRARKGAEDNHATMDVDVPPGSVSKDPVSLLQAHNAEVFVVAWSPTTPGQLVSGSRDATVNYWNIPSSSYEASNSSPPRPTLTFSNVAPSPKADLTSIDWSPDGSLVAIGSYDSSLRIYTSAGKAYLSDDHHKGPIFAAKFSPSGQWIATASLDSTSCVWDIKNKRLYQQYRNHEEGACCLDVDWIDDSTFASGGSDRVVHIVSLNGVKPIQTLRGHDGEVNMIKCNPSRTRLATSSDDTTARIWNIEHPHSEKSITTVLKGHKRSLTAIKWCPNNQAGEHELVATASFDFTARLWNSVTGDCLGVFTDHTKYVFALSFSPDGSLLVTGGGDGSLNMYDVKTRERIWTWSSGEKTSVFEIDWKEWGEQSLIALAMEHKVVGVVDLAKLPQHVPRDDVDDMLII